MKKLFLTILIIICFVSLLLGQNNTTNWNIQVAPWVLGQVKVKYEFTQTNERSYGCYCRFSWESQLLSDDEILSYFTSDFRGIRFEPFIRFYLLPRERKPLHGFYFQLHGLCGIYEDLYVYSWEDTPDNPFMSAGVGFKMGFQTIIIGLSNDVNLGLKLHLDLGRTDSYWFDGPGFPVTTDLLFGFSF